MSESIIDSMAGKSAPWLSGDGPDSSAVLSSRIRLARNIVDFPFPSSADTDSREEILQFLSPTFGKVPALENGSLLYAADIDSLSQKFLMERHLISPEFTRGGSGRGIFIKNDEKISIMLNEEDHIRLQVISSGISLVECWALANEVDNDLSRHVEFDFNEKFGYLTSCPTNVGTGLRASILIHLPGLVHTGEIESMIGNISKVGLVVRGFYGEGTDVLGNLFQISNQTTLGQTEEEIIDSLAKVTRKIIENEQNAQDKLMSDAPDQIEDKVWRSYGILCNARVLTSSEVMNLLSALRLGLSLNLIDKFSFRELNELMIIIQPAHLQKFVGREMDNVERDMVRADLVRDRFSKTEES
jgi:protein arginine kinase